MRRNSCGRVWRAISTSVPAQFDAGGAGADDGKFEPGRTHRRLGTTLGLLEGTDDASPDVEGVSQGLQARRMRGPMVLAEIAVHRSGGHDQVVIGQALAVVDQHRLPGDIDVRHLGLQHRQAAPLHFAPQHMADGRADGRCAEAGGGHLVEQGLEEVVVGAVDQGDFQLRRASQRTHGLEPAEAAADDKHLVDVRHGPSPGPAQRSVRSFQISGNSTTSSILRR